MTINEIIINEIELRKIALEIAIKERDYLSGEKTLIEVAKQILNFMKDAEVKKIKEVKGY